MTLEDYAIHPFKVYRLLQSKKVEFLYHANTVTTSVTFINAKALLSRRYVEVNNLLQTKQRSDDEDKRFGVWDDIFLDGQDLHKRYKRANYYGPILFVLKLSILTNPNIHSIYITKSNPMYWKNNMTLSDKYYSGAEEVIENYLTGKRLDSQIMFTIKSPERAIKLKKFLAGILIDRPRITIRRKSNQKQNVGEYAQEKIRNALDTNGLRYIPIRFRHEKGLGWCQCEFNYQFEHKMKYKEFSKKFALLK